MGTLLGPGGILFAIGFVVLLVISLINSDESVSTFCSIGAIACYIIAGVIGAGRLKLIELSNLNGTITFVNTIFVIYLLLLIFVVPVLKASAKAFQIVILCLLLCVMLATSLIHNVGCFIEFGNRTKAKDAGVSYSNTEV